MLLLNLVFTLLGFIFSIVGLIFVVLGLFGQTAFFVLFGCGFLLPGILFGFIGIRGFFKYQKIFKNGKRVTGIVMRHGYNFSVRVNCRPLIDLLVQLPGDVDRLVCVHTDTCHQFKYPVGSPVVVVLDCDSDKVLLDAKETCKLNSTKSM